MPGIFMRNPLNLSICSMLSVAILIFPRYSNEKSICLRLIVKEMHPAWRNGEPKKCLIWLCMTFSRNLAPKSDHMMKPSISMQCHFTCLSYNISCFTLLIINLVDKNNFMQLFQWILLEVCLKSSNCRKRKIRNKLQGKSFRSSRANELKSWILLYCSIISAFSKLLDFFFINDADIALNQVQKYLQLLQRLITFLQN